MCWNCRFRWRCNKLKLGKIVIFSSTGRLVNKYLVHCWGWFKKLPIISLLTLLIFAWDLTLLIFFTGFSDFVDFITRFFDSVDIIGFSWCITGFLDSLDSAFAFDFLTLLIFHWIFDSTDFHHWILLIHYWISWLCWFFARKFLTLLIFHWFFDSVDFIFHVDSELVHFSLHLMAFDSFGSCIFFSCNDCIEIFHNFVSCNHGLKKIQPLKIIISFCPLSLEKKITTLISSV